MHSIVGNEIQISTNFEIGSSEIRSAMAGAIADEQLMLQQQRHRGDGAHAPWADEFRQGDQQVDGENEEGAHVANRITTAVPRKTAWRGRIPLCCEFATHRLAILEARQFVGDDLSGSSQ
jgi:hypothetical protein